MKIALTISGLGLQVVYYILAVLSLCNYEYSGHGIGKAFAFWIYAMLTASLCVLIYCVEAVYTQQKDKSRFHTIKLVSVILAIPLLVFIGMTAAPVCSVIWNIYFIGLFLLEIVSLCYTDAKPKDHV